MTDSISDGTHTITPTLIDGYTAKRTSRNVVHPILSANAVAVSLRDAGLRAGTLRLVFSSESSAEAAVGYLSVGLEFTLTSSSRSWIGMTFVVAGDVTIELDDDTRDVWIVSFDFQETN